MKGTLKICYSTAYVFFRANVIFPRNWSILWLYPSKREVCLTDSQLQLKTKVERQGPILFSVLVRCPCYTVWTKRSKESDGPNIQSRTFLGFGLPHKTVHTFRNFLAVLSPPTPPPPLHHIQNWNSEKILHTHVRGEGLGMCELKSAPEMQRCPKTFFHDCRCPFHRDVGRTESQLEGVNKGRA